MGKHGDRTTWSLLIQGADETLVSAVMITQSESTCDQTTVNWGGSGLKVWGDFRAAERGASRGASTGPIDQGGKGRIGSDLQFTAEPLLVLPGIPNGCRPVSGFNQCFQSDNAGPGLAWVGIYPASPPVARRLPFTRRGGAA